MWLGLFLWGCVALLIAMAVSGLASAIRSWRDGSGWWSVVEILFAGFMVLMITRL